MQHLSNLVHLHSALQEDIQRLLQANAELHEKNRKIEIEIESINNECKEFVAIQGKQHGLAIMKAKLDAEDAALDALEKHSVLLEKRVASLQIRLNAVVKEQKERNRALVTECNTARDRFASSFQGLQARKRTVSDRLEEQRATAMRFKVKLDHLEEERAKVEADINSTRELALEHENNCKEWMEAIANVVRSRRHRPRTTKPQAKSKENNSNTIFAVQTFDVVKAFREQQLSRGL